jgi:hypothetical protein
VSTAHNFIGYLVVSSFGLLMLLGGLRWLGQRRGFRALFGWAAGDGVLRFFWGLVTGIQVTLVVQMGAGITLLALGHTRPLLHYLYGSLFPVIVLVAAHVVGRSLQRDQWVAFAWAGFFCFGLTLRALATGLGIG